jgi:uracil-DNA glycosylase
VDLPKSLSSQREREARLAHLALPHMASLASFVQALREQMGASFQVPDFDPCDGGVEAECLFLLEAPGPKAIRSGFVSRNNPDETAKNFFLLNQEVSIPRGRTVIWNIVPWYIGSESTIRPANGADVWAGLPSLRRLLSLLPKLRAVVLVGQKAASAELEVQKALPRVSIFTVRHPSPMFVNRLPGNRALLLAQLSVVAAFVKHGKSPG